MYRRQGWDKEGTVGLEELENPYPEGRVIAGTGHRHFGAARDRDGRTQEIDEVVCDWLNNMLHALQPRCVISGMAIGFDTYLAREALAQKIPLVAAVPFSGQEAPWPDNARKEYRRLLSRATRVQIVEDGGYANWKYHRRNQWMVDNCDILLAAWNGKSGGTANCVAYARQVRRRIEFLPGLRPEAIEEAG